MSLLYKMSCRLAEVLTTSNLIKGWMVFFETSVPYFEFSIPGDIKVENNVFDYNGLFWRRCFKNFTSPANIGAGQLFK